jgi:hypothetical protein
MQGNSVNPVNLNSSKHPFAELINLAGKGEISPELANKLSQFLVPIIYGKLYSNQKMGKQVEKKYPKEFRIAINKYVSEYLHKNKKLPPHIRLRALIKNYFKGENPEKKLVFEILDKSLKEEREVKNPLKKEKGSPLKEKVKAQIPKNSEKAEKFTKNLPQKNTLPKTLKDQKLPNKEIFKEKGAKTNQPRAKSSINTPNNTFKEALRKFGKILFFNPKTSSKEKPLEKHIEKSKITDIRNNPKLIKPSNIKYSTSIFLKFISQIKATLKAINTSKTVPNQTSNQAKTSAPLFPIIAPPWKRHKIDSYSVRERRRVKRKGECSDESGGDGPDYHHPEDED